ncbi:MAG: RNA polymerase sigma factor [Prevotella sp.]
MELYEKEDISIRLINPTTRREAFAELVNQYSEQLYWQIRRIVLSHEDADDVLQNVFMKAWKNIDTFRSDSKLSTWLYRIAVNESIDFTRHKNAIGMVSSDDDNSSTISSRLLADEYFDGDQIQAILQEAIATLPEKQRMIFNMRYYDEMKYTDMSDILGTSVGALKASYHIAVKKISEYFKQRD